MTHHEAAQILEDETFRVLGGLQYRISTCKEKNCDICTEDKTRVTKLSQVIGKIHKMRESFRDEDGTGEFSRFLDLYDSIVENATEMLGGISPHSV